jgi:hypothetical protein
MNQEKTETRTYALNYGVLFGIISVVFSLMLFLLDMHYQNETFQQIVSLIIIIGCIMVSLLAFKKDNDGYINLSEAIKIGLGISLIGAIIGFLYFLILINFLDPDVLEKGYKYQSEIMKMNNPEISQEILETTVEMQRKFSSPGIIFAVVLIFNLFIGFIISLIGGLIIKKSRPE